MALKMILLFTMLGLVARPSAQVSHEIWDSLLQKHVSALGKVDYEGLNKDRSRLESYLQLLREHTPTEGWSQNERLAYWINAYNAFTVQLILDHYPIQSIRDIDKPWDTPFIHLGGQTYSLNQIEHEIIRKQFEEPRIHFAVNCAAQSCPPLLNRAYVSDQLDRQLEQQTRAYVNNPKHNVLSKEKAELSEIFNWYRDDFTKGSTLIAFINRYSRTPVGVQAAISFKPYDWRLNN